MPLREFTSKYFIGRTREIGILQNIASQAGSGDASSIILLGKRGIGKTALLKHLFSELFSGKSNVIPFLYTVNPVFASVENFSEDYLSNFILQSLAFAKKDSSFINSGTHSLKDLKDIANKSGASWATDIINNYFHVRESADPLKLFSFTVSVPYQSCRMTGMPVVVIIDDFHKIRKISAFKTKDYSKDLWMCFENSINFQYTPHILAGFQTDLYKMFFEDTSFGEHLEVMNLPGLDRENAFRLLGSLCDKYTLGLEPKLKESTGLFSGNPFYIKSFVQAARHAASSLTEDNFWDIYAQEITKGKISTYWTSILKTYISRFELRKPALKVLYNLSLNDRDDIYVKIQDVMSIERGELDSIVNMLHVAGTLEMGFSTIEFTDDTVLADVIKGLYHREILREPSGEIKKAIVEGKSTYEQLSGTPSFSITIPATPKAELVAVKSLEQVSRHFNMPPDAVGQMQMSLVQLFAGVLANNGEPGECYQVKFILKENIFTIEILANLTDLCLTDQESRHINAYVDDIRVETVLDGSRVTLVKVLNKDFISTS